MNLAWLLTTGLEVHSLAGPQEFENFRALVPWSDGVSWLVGLLVIAGLIVAAIDVLRAIPRRRWDDRSAVALLLVDVAAHSDRGAVQSSHAVVRALLPAVLPAPFVVIGYLVARMTLTRSSRLRRSAPPEMRGISTSLLRC